MGVRLNLAKAQGRHSLSNSKSHCWLHTFNESSLFSKQFITDASVTYLDGERRDADVTLGLLSS